MEQALHEHQVQIEALNQHLQRAMTETHHRVKNNFQGIVSFGGDADRKGLERVPFRSWRALNQQTPWSWRSFMILAHHQTKHGGEAENLSVRASIWISSILVTGQ